jgi:hypothetical protein
MRNRSFQKTSKFVPSGESVIRDLTILGRQRDGDGQNKLLQVNGSKDSSSYIINRMHLIQF